ncbi:ATP-binding protein [Streptomyces sp. NPDC006984]|uniref:ATP-binding protein n=1 Tax=Streptomyces sp. NPDC006984 TaxID=3155463 RepID=UPI0033FE7440
MATGGPGYSSTFPCSPQSAQKARSVVQSALRTWGMDRLAPEALIIVSELASNAVVHGEGLEIEVCVRQTAPGCIRVEIADGSSSLPVLAHPDLDAESGRGLVLVDMLADRWGTEKAGSGKLVWAELSGAAAPRRTGPSSNPKECP